MKALLVAIFLSTSACAPLAIWSAPAKTAAPVPSTLVAKAANDRFWNALHGGRYDELPEVLEQLQQVYLRQPSDAETAAHIGFAHVWRVSESARLPPRASITDDIVLSRKYFGEAVALSPHDARFQGFYAGMTLSEGSINADEKLKRTGYYALMDSINAWPEFNLFTAGYVMSRLPYDDAKYKDSVEYQWKTLDLCAEERFDRARADFTPYMAKENREGPKRACWNSWIAPHNVEGFFLNMGDMLVKQGDVETAKKIYANARLSKTYQSWPFKAVLEQRIAQAENNVNVFRTPARDEKEHTMMISSSFSCMGCHQKSDAE